MQIKHTMLRLVGASLIAVGVVPFLGGASSSADTGGTAKTTGNAGAAESACVAPDPAVFLFERLDPTTYRVSLRDPATITCAPVTFNVASFTIPATWDRNGFNETAFPQVEFDYVALTFPAGAKGPVTATVKVPSCGPFQSDLYTGPRRPSPLVFPNPLGSDHRVGTIRDQAACATQTPTETPTVTVTPPVAPTVTVTPPAVAATVPQAPNTVTTAAVVAPVTSATSSPSDSASVLGTKIAKPSKKATVGPAESASVQAEKRATLPHTGGGSNVGLLLTVALALLLGGASLLLLPGHVLAKVQPRRH